MDRCNFWSQPYFDTMLNPWGPFNETPTGSRAGPSRQRGFERISTEMLYPAMVRQQAKMFDMSKQDLIMLVPWHVTLFILIFNSRHVLRPRPLFLLFILNALGRASLFCRGSLLTSLLPGQVCHLCAGAESLRLIKEDAENMSSAADECGPQTDSGFAGPAIQMPPHPGSTSSAWIKRSRHRWDSSHAMRLFAVSVTYLSVGYGSLLVCRCQARARQAG